MSMRSARLTVASLIFFGVVACAHFTLAQEKRGAVVPWSYSAADGPDHWGDLEPDFAACKVGKLQSPIDIKDIKEAELAPIRFDYKLSPLKIVNNGHTVRVDYEPGSSATANGVTLPLTHFIFHRRSETEINGQNYDMELQFFHEDPASGRTIVVSVLIQSGNENALLRVLMGNVPQKIGEVVEKKKVVLNAANFLPADQNYYTFDGSLTTPPCSEGAKWYVMKTPIEASPSQIAAFSKLYPDNARPVQPLNGREILESNFHK